MAIRRRSVIAALVLGLVIAASTRGQVPGPYPKLPDGVRTPPREAVVNAPFDVDRLFESPPLDENAEPLYLDALFEFGPDVASCFPEGPERDRRRQLALDRKQVFNAVVLQWLKAPKTVSSGLIDAVVADYAEGFRKLAEAQRREHCVFRTGVGFTTRLSHVQAARYVAQVVQLRGYRELKRGEIDAAIDDVQVVLRLARDLQPRGCIIGQLVTVAMETVVYRDLIAPILAVPDLLPPQCGRLLLILNGHEAQAIDAYSESLMIKYISIRVTLYDLVRNQAKLARALGLPPGAPVAKNIVNPPLAVVPNDFDAQLARTTPDEFDRVVERLDDYYKALLALKDLPVIERIRRLPDVSDYFSGDDPLMRLAGSFQPGVANVTQAMARADATTRAAECLVALRLWQLTHSGVALTSADLVPACRDAGLKAVPLDPYNGHPMRLAVIDGVPVVYSVGKDGRDDHGRIDSDFDRHPGDLTFRMPPVVAKPPR